MVQYIRKDTLVREIEARMQKLLPMVGFATTPKGASMQAASEELKHILSFINTIEVKEVDLEKEYKEFVEKDPVYNKLVNNIVGRALLNISLNLVLKQKKENNMKIKSYTDLKQSKKLAEILSPESADMIYCYTKKEDKLIYPIPIYLTGTLTNTFKYLYCWSLAALFGVLPEIQGCKPIIALDDNYITYPHMNNLYVEADNIVDACVAMIEKLHELKLL